MPIPFFSETEVIPTTHQIHYDFDTAGDRILLEVQNILRECKLRNDINSKIYLDALKKRDTAEYYRQKYPKYKYITRTELINLCNKYGLVIGNEKMLKLSIPDSNKKEIEIFCHDFDSADKGYYRIDTSVRRINPYGKTIGGFTTWLGRGFIYVPEQKREWQRNPWEEERIFEIHSESMKVNYDEYCAIKKNRKDRIHELQEKLYIKKIIKTESIPFWSHDRKKRIEGIQAEQDEFSIYQYDLSKKENLEDCYFFSCERNPKLLSHEKRELESELAGLKINIMDALRNKGMIYEGRFTDAEPQKDIFPVIGTPDVFGINMKEKKVKDGMVVEHYGFFKLLLFAALSPIWIGYKIIHPDPIVLYALKKEDNDDEQSYLVITKWGYEATLI